jgi:hypothetical protein
VNWSADEVAEVPPAVVTVTLTVPADSAGEVVVMEVAEFTVTAVAVTTPNITVVPDVKPVPAMDTEVPPEVGPEVGVIEVIVGDVVGGGGVLDASAGISIDPFGDPRPAAREYR